jgi:FixJ family two-component response regulator
VYRFPRVVQHAKCPLRMHNDNYTPSLCFPWRNPGKGRCVPREFVIAVIEDDDSFRVALAESLRSLGYNSREFSSAEEFIAHGELEPCDCVITDIHMPGMSGFDLSRLLTSRPSPIPVILITAVAKPGLEAKVAASGSSFLLKKPFETDALIDCLQKVLKD